MVGKNEAVALKVGDRFYMGHSKSGRLQTAWGLCAARLFYDWNCREIEKAEAEVAKRGRKCERVLVGVRES
jgi:hypothetical protein